MSRWQGFKGGFKSFQLSGAKGEMTAFALTPQVCCFYTNQKTFLVPLLISVLKPSSYPWYLSSIWGSEIFRFSPNNSTIFKGEWISCIGWLSHHEIKNKLKEWNLSSLCYYIFSTEPKQESHQQHQLKHAEKNWTEKLKNTTMKRHLWSAQSPMSEFFLRAWR